MSKTTKDRYKKQFETALTGFTNDLKSYVSTTDGDWTVKGFIDLYKNIYTISADTKIISKILEIHIFPQLLKFADDNGYRIVFAEKQNWYPDVTFIDISNEDIKFALDIKTTFRRKAETAGFTLGSHGAYFRERDKDKNIQFPYNQYSAHYCLGIIYSRTELSEAFPETEIFQAEELLEKNETPARKIGEREVTTVKELSDIISVIKNFEFFVAEKWKIASDKPGSGNTANIGSINNIEDLKAGRGIFSKLGEEWFDEYWINYGTATMIKDGEPVKIFNIWDYLEFKGRKDLFKKVVSRGKPKIKDK